MDVQQVIECESEMVNEVRVSPQIRRRIKATNYDQFEFLIVRLGP